MAQFYTPNIQIDAKQYVLNEEESKHCIRVLRLKVGDSLQLMDGKGGVFKAKITIENSKKCEVDILGFQKFEKSPLLHLVVAPTKNMERMEWLVEKGTELGCTQFSFIHTLHCERNQLKMERLEKICISAMKQSKRAYLPTLDSMISLNAFLEKYKGGFVAHCDTTQLRNTFKPGLIKRVLIGPEGDFSSIEIEAIIKADFVPITLGDERLRTETAALCALIQMKML